MRAVAITSLIALGSALFAGGPSADQLAGLMKAGAAIKDGASITTKFGGSTVSVTRQNGVVTCTVDGKPIALRVRGPAPKPAALMPVAVPAIAVQQASQAATGSNPLIQNPLIWIGTPNPTPPPGTVIHEFQPLANLPDFARSQFGWMRDFEFEACVLGLSSVTRGQSVVGPYGTATTGFSSSGCA
jgi:hypothetical protein